MSLALPASDTLTIDRERATKGLLRPRYPFASEINPSGNCVALPKTKPLPLDYPSESRVL
jgi:hypothetical protein